MPATTCAFVITWSLLMTNPLPSMVREQLGARPSIFTTLFRSLRRPAECTTAGSSFGTFSAVSAPSAPNTCT